MKLDITKKDFENLRQNLFIDTIKKNVAIDIFINILEKNKIYIDLDWIDTERNLLNLLYIKLSKIDKINKIFKDYDISKNNFWIMDFDYISDELEIAELKIVFNNIDKISLEIQKILNSLISIRERKIIYIMIWNLGKYYFYTWIEDIHIKEWDDYFKIEIN